MHRVGLLCAWCMECTLLLLLKSNTAGVARQLVTFFCVTKKKVTQEKAPPVCRPCGVPCVARLVRRLRNSRYALTNLRYSAAHRGKQNPKTLKS